MMTLKILLVFLLLIALGITLAYWGQLRLQESPSPQKTKSNDYLNQLLENLAKVVNNTSLNKHFQEFFGKPVTATPTASATNLEVKSDMIRLDNVERIGVICYVPKGDHQALHFLTMLYGSWKYIADNKQEYLSSINTNNFHYIDLLAFCHPNICPSIQSACKAFNAHDNVKHIEMNCWAIEQTFESPVPYGPINSFVMFNRTDIYEILAPYSNVIRTDYDVFITPALLTWQPSHRVMFGKGGYCDPFNMKRLKEISVKLGMRHQGVHCIGSTWYGETKRFIELSKKTYEMTGYMYLNEFDVNAPGLETIDFKKNREGEWIRWWRPVSLLYGAELALNHLIDDISQKHKGELDTPSCSTKKFWDTPHIHCWHSDCEFQKFKFMRHLNAAVKSKETLSGEIVHRLIENTYDQKINNMTIAQYSTFIAWNSVGKHLRKWFS